MKDMTKRAVLFFLALALLVACTGCGGGGGTSTPSNDSNTVQTPDNSETSDEPEQPETTFEFSGTPQQALLTGVELAETGDKENAMLHFEWAAAHGDSGVLSDVASYYMNESLGLQEYEKAREYFERLANEGSGYAHMMLGQIYLTPLGVERNPVKAREYFEKAAESDHDWSAGRALFFLGQIYENGDGVPQDNAKALECYQKAAEKDYADESAAKKADELRAKLNG